MKKREVFYVDVTVTNHRWIKKQMKKLGYHATRGKSKYFNDLIAGLRGKAK